MKTEHKWPDLPQLVAAENFPLKRHGRCWSGNTCPDCGESSARSDKFSVFQGNDGRWRFKCFGCGCYGDGADFIAKSRNISLGDALKFLDEPDAAFKRSLRKVGKTVTNVPSRAEAEERAAVREVVAILKESALSPEPRAYLEGRKLLTSTLDMAVASGELRTLPMHPEGARKWLTKHVGVELLRRAGMLGIESDWPALAFKPILALDPGGFGVECRVATAEYEGPKAIRYGRMKWPWYFSHEDSPSSILVTEGIIDALSAWQSLPEARATLGIPGVNGWAERWFVEIKKRLPDTTILIGFDVDKPGKEGVPALAEMLDKVGLHNVVMRPPQGKDWNEALKLSDLFI